MEERESEENDFFFSPLCYLKKNDYVFSALIFLLFFSSIMAPSITAPSSGRLSRKKREGRFFVRKKEEAGKNNKDEKERRRDDDDDDGDLGTRPRGQRAFF